MSKQWKAPFLALVAVLALDGVAQAGPITVGGQYDVSNQSGSVFTPNGPDNGYFSGVTFRLNNATNVSASAGVFALDYRAWLSGDPWTAFLSFCLQPNVSLGSFDPPYTANTVGGAGYDQNRIAELWGRFYGQIFNPTNGQTNDVNAAAFQVALWELSYGDRLGDLSMGDFQLVNGGVIQAVAQGWIYALTGDTSRMATGLVVLVDDQAAPDRQDLITRVPEPATLALLGLGLLGVGCARRRRVAA